MSDRKLRTIGVLSFISGMMLVVISLILFWFNIPANISLPVLIVYTVIQFRFSPFLFNKIYQSRVVDMPGRLVKRFPPQAYDSTYGYSDVLLLRTPSAVLSGPDCGESLGLGYLASTLRDSGIKVDILDSRLEGLDGMQTVELIHAYNPKSLGVNLNFQYLAPSTAELLRALRERGYAGHITLGGLYASVAYEEILEKIPAVDTVVRFEGEYTYSELMKNLNDPNKWVDIEGLVYRGVDGEININPLRSLIPDLNTIPDPSRDKLPIAAALGGYAYVVSSRGCNGACAYCVQQRAVMDPLGKRWRGRDANDVADEVECLNKDYGIYLFSFVDDDFFGTKVDGKTHARRVADALIKRDLDVSILLSVQPRDVEYEEFEHLKRAGVNSVILAVDNFSQPVLDRYRKFTTVEQNLHSIEILNSLDIDAYLGIIMFDPWTTPEELVENLERIRDIPFLRPWQVLSKLEVYRGSPITEDLDKGGLLDWNGYSASYDYQDDRILGLYVAIETIMKTLNASMSELDRFRWGNLTYSVTDEWILKYFKEPLAEINAEFNHKALSLTLEIVSRQESTSDALSPDDLADQMIQRDAQNLNRDTIWEIKNLRNAAKEYKEDSELESETAEVLET